MPKDTLLFTATLSTCRAGYPRRAHHCWGKSSLRWRGLLAWLLVAGVAIATSDARAASLSIWGDNQYGQLGDGTTNHRATPGSVPSLTSDVTAVAGGGSHTLAVQNGAVFDWGINNAGQLGDGLSSSFRTTPYALPSLSSGVTAIAAGSTTSLALQNGAVYTWGADGTTGYDYTPVAVTGLSSGVTAIAGGNVYSLAVQNGGAYAWGYNGVGQLGDGSTTNHSAPAIVSGLSSGVTAIAAGQNHSLAVQNGNVYAWGYNDFGKLGDGTVTQRNSPVAVTGLPGAVTAIAAGASHSLAVQNGHVFAWGGNANGELGDGTTTTSLTPQLIDPGDLHDIITVAAGGNSSYALSSNGSMWVWGFDLFGQMGLGTFQDDYLTPQHLLPPNGYRFTSIDADAMGAHAVAMLTVVPEPSTFMLTGIGFLFLLICTRRSCRVAPSSFGLARWTGCARMLVSWFSTEPTTAKAAVSAVPVGQYNATTGATVNPALISGLSTFPFDITVVPEPGSIVLAALGFAGLATGAGRKRVTIRCRHRTSIRIASLLVVFSAASHLFHPTASFASTITFDEPQFSGAPLHFALATPGGAFGPLITVGGVTFNGGVVLNGATSFASEETTVPNLYETFDAHFTLADVSQLPGIVSAAPATPASSISLDIFDGHSASDFTLTGFAADNSVVNSETIFLHSFNSSVPDPLSIGTASISGPAISYFTVTSSQGAGLIDFGIDTVNVTLVPEPASIVLSGIGIMICLCVAARRRRNA